MRSTDIPGSTGLPGGRKESSTSHSHSTRAALPLPLGPSGESPGAGHIRCTSSKISKEGIQSKASWICKSNRTIYQAYTRFVMESMGIFHGHLTACTVQMPCSKYSTYSSVQAKGVS